MAITYAPFWTPIDYTWLKAEEAITWTDWIIELVDDVFYIYGEKAFVNNRARDVELIKDWVYISEQEPERDLNAIPYFSTILKVILYATIILPLILFACKVILRCIDPFKIMVFNYNIPLPTSS